MDGLLPVVRNLLAYTIWADGEHLHALAAVRPEDLRRDTGSSFPSLLATMGHVLGSERVWLSRFVGAPGHLPTLSQIADFAALRSGFEELWPELEAYLAALADQDLARPLTWTNTKGVTRTQPLWSPLVHMVNHSSYHRGQVVTMLRQLGYPAPGTDLVYFLADHLRIR
ncbi:MAG TPA: DinB family protein [Thermoanaerobaculia bacterium]|nr:DinB family protein [Thermoanaerobaculia bacterium]